MSRANKKPRRAYDPNRWLMRTHATQRIRMDGKPLLPDQRQDLGLNYWLCFDVMKRGGSESAWNALAQTANIALVIAEMGIGSEYIDAIKRAQDALMRIDYRQKHSGSWAMDAEGMAALHHCLTIHDSQMEIAERGEIRKCIAEVNKRLTAGDILSVEKV